MTHKEQRQTPSTGFESEFPILAFSAGDWIYRRGQRDDCMYVIESGSVELLLTDPHSTAEQRIGLLERGDFLGELGVLEEDRRSSCARAVEDCRLLPLDGMALQQICDQQPGLAFRMLRSLAERCGHLEGELFDLWIDFFHEKADTNPPAPWEDTIPQLVNRRNPDPEPSSPKSVGDSGREQEQADPSEIATAELAGMEPTARPLFRPRAEAPTGAVGSAYEDTLIAPLPTADDGFIDDSTRKLRSPGAPTFSDDDLWNRGSATLSSSPVLEDSQALIDTQQPSIRTRDAGERARSGASARLVALDEGLQFLLRGEFETTIGRSSRTDPFVPDIDLSELNSERTVSRRHASVFVHNEQYSLVEHERVANGTSVNGIRLVPGRPRKLADGDRLCFGTVILMFRLGAS